MSAGSKSLKAANLKWLTSIAAIDVVVVAAFAVPDLLGSQAITALQAIRTATITSAPVVIMLITTLLPAEVKASLVFWRLREVLPGHRAFTILGPKDPRVAMDALQRNVGALPADPSQQNALWYRLYKKVENDPSVVEAHKTFLLWRDACTLSAVLLPIVPTGIWLFLASADGTRISLCFFLAQFFLSAIAARQQGTRFVCNVLALHSSKRLTAPPRSTARRPA